jgi:hypothetical protein
MPSTIWSIPILGGEAQKLAEVEDMLGGGAVSPDGSNIAYQRLRSIGGAREIWVMGSHGESPHKILTAENEATILGIAWSAAGNRLAYRYRRNKGDRTDIMVQSCDLNGGDRTTILLDNHLTAFTWTLSGRFIYSRNSENGSAESDNLWELKIDGKSGIPHGKAHKLTDWSGFSVYSFSFCRGPRRQRNSSPELPSVDTRRPLQYPCGMDAKLSRSHFFIAANHKPADVSAGARAGE